MKRTDNVNLTFAATLPDGRRIERSSKTMTYGFVVCIGGGSKRWGAVRWSQTQAAAEKEARSWRGYIGQPGQDFTEVKVIPCEVK
jgi:hypothetical protein